MDELSLYRSEIDQIDKQMKDLFLKRMEIVKKITKWKIKHDYPIFDPKREKFFVEQNSKDIVHSPHHDTYVAFLNSLLALSKEYQNQLMEEMNQ